MNKNLRHNIKSRHAAIFFFIVLADQYFKFLAKNFLYCSEINFRIIKFIYAENSGISFGLFGDKKMYLVLLAVILNILAAFFYLKKFLNYCGATPIIFILSGTISNFLDRFFYKFVVDYISVPIFPAIFNLADCFICVGTFLVIFKILKKY
ncbi:MAG: signal peptidase II [Oscillospiraceae bacterium]|jgi:signal peptidase II|nr:signal peptidase II [Oscillospiraceae bacterium]